MQSFQKLPTLPFISPTTFVDQFKDESRTDQLQLLCEEKKRERERERAIHTLTNPHVLLSEKYRFGFRL